jgi:hypothetical protein
MSVYEVLGMTRHETESCMPWVRQGWDAWRTQQAKRQTRHFPTSAGCVLSGTEMDRQDRLPNNGRGQPPETKGTPRAASCRYLELEDKVSNGFRGGSGSIRDC